MLHIPPSPIELDPRIILLVLGSNIDCFFSLGTDCEVGALFLIPIKFLSSTEYPLKVDMYFMIT